MKVLDRLEVLAGIGDNNYEEVARGISRSTWEDMKKSDQKKYVDAHPTSIYYYEFYSKAIKDNISRLKVQINDLKGILPKYKTQKKRDEIQSKIDVLKKKGVKLQDFLKKLNSKFSIKPVPSKSKVVPTKVTTIKPVVKVEEKETSTLDKDIKFTTDLIGDFKHKINKDGTVDAYEKIRFYFKGIDKIPINFGKVHGNFVIEYCWNIKSLEGTPREVDGNFELDRCSGLKSLKGAPEKIAKSLILNNCPNLTSLEGSPKEIGGNLDITKCRSLKSLKGAPEKVGGSLYLNGYNFTSLEGAPKEVNGDFNCLGCDGLKSLKGAPEKVGGKVFVPYRFRQEAIKKYGAKAVD